MLNNMKSDTSYIKTAEKANIDKAYTRVAYHIQRARWHLDQVTTQDLANDIDITKQALQARINVYKKEVTDNAR